jgi:hypothetical protein
MRLLAAAILTACAPSYEPQFASIERKLSSLEQRVEDADQHAKAASSSAALAVAAASAASNECSKPPPAAPKPPPQWSCAANCIKSFNCASAGTSNIKWKALTSTGSTAADAFRALEDQCSDEMYVDGKCTDGKFVRTAATIVNACVRN